MWCTSSTYSEVIVLFCWFAPSIRKPFIMFCYVTFHFVEASLLCAVLVLFWCGSTWLVWYGIEQGLVQGFVSRFGTVLYKGVWNTFSLISQTKGHTLIQC